MMQSCCRVKVSVPFTLQAAIRTLIAPNASTTVLSAPMQSSADRREEDSRRGNVLSRVIDDDSDPHSGPPFAQIALGPASTCWLLPWIARSLLAPAQLQSPLFKTSFNAGTAAKMRYGSLLCATTIV